MTDIETLIVITFFLALFTFGGVAWMLVETPNMIYKHFKAMREKEAEEAAKAKYLERDRLDYEKFERWKASFEKDSPDSSPDASSGTGRIKPLPPDGSSRDGGKDGNWY